jgi:hypothetical protein
MHNAAMARIDTQVNLRIPERLLEKLRMASEDAGRSLTAEIVDRLEGSFPLSPAEALLQMRSTELAHLTRALALSEWELGEFQRRKSEGDFGPWGELRMNEDIRSLTETVAYTKKLIEVATKQVDQLKKLSSPEVTGRTRQM